MCQNHAVPTGKRLECVREFEPIGKYRVRLMKKEGEEAYLDIREYVKSERFEGFTRRGIKVPPSALLDLAEKLREKPCTDPMEQVREQYRLDKSLPDA